VGAMDAPLINDISGLPLNYTFLVNNDVDLANVSFAYKLPAGTTLDSAMPTNFSSISKQSVMLKSSWGTRKVYITVKKIKSASTDVDIKFDVTNTNSWTASTEGWIANGISTTVTSKAQFATENSDLVVASANIVKQVSFDISMEVSGFTGIFTVESSSDAILWNSLKHYNSCNVISSSVSRVVADLPENTKYVRFVYNCKNGSQIVNVNNIQMVRATSSKVETQLEEKLILYPNPAHSQINISNSNSVKELSFYSVSGMLVKRIQNVGSVVDVNDLKQGVYFVKSSLSTGTVCVSQLIIQ